jgi:hypothetical protein
VAVLSRGGSRAVFWSELQQHYRIMWADDIEIPNPKLLLETDIPAQTLQVEAGTGGELHVLWYSEDRAREHRILFYSLINPGLEEVERIQLDHIGIREHLNGRLALEGEKVHLVWSRWVRTGAGRPGLELNYAVFTGGQPLHGPLALAGSNSWRMSGPDIGVNNGIIEIVWASDMDKDNEIFYGFIRGDEITDITRLTWSPSNFIMPRIFQCQGYSYVLYKKVANNRQHLHLIENRNPEIPGVWHRLGLDPDNVLGSMLYKLGWVLSASGMLAGFGVVQIALGVLILCLFHKYLGGYPRTKLGFLFSLILLCTMMFIFASNDGVNLAGEFAALGAGYQLYLFLVVTISVTGLFYFLGYGDRDEPLLYAKAAFAWCFLWYVVTGVSQIPFVVV